MCLDYLTCRAYTWQDRYVPHDLKLGYHDGKRYDENNNDDYDYDHNDDDNKNNDRHNMNNSNNSSNNNYNDNICTNTPITNNDGDADDNI